MLKRLLSSKIHKAKVTDKSVDYEGSMGIDQDLMDACGMSPYEKILVGNMANGNRFETYAIPATRGSGDIVLNGATAHLGNIGDLLTIMCFSLYAEEELVTHRPRVILVSDTNQIVRTEIPPIA